MGKIQRTKTKTQKCASGSFQLSSESQTSLPFEFDVIVGTLPGTQLSLDSNIPAVISGPGYSVLMS